MAGTVVADLFAKLGLMPDVKSWAKGDKLISGIKTGLASIAGVFAVSGVVGMIKDTVALGGELSDTSQAIGVGVEALQELRYAAGFAGVASEDLTGSIGKFAKGMTEAQKTGKGPFVDALRSLRISMRDLKGESLDQNLEVIADRFKAMPNGAKKTALAMQLFGKSGAKLIPFLNEGQAGIVKLRNEARELGVVLDEKSVGDLDTLGDDVDRFKLSLTGLKNQAVVALLPMLQELVTGLLGWVKANREIIRSTIAGAMQVVVAILKVFGQALSAVTKVIQFFVENSELGKSVLIALGIVLAVFAVKAAAAWIAAFAPVVLAIAVIAGIVLGIRMLVKHWDKVKAAMRAAGRAVLDALRGMWNSIKAVGNRIKDFFVEDIPNAIIGAFTAAWDSLVDGAKAAWRELKGIPIIGHILRGGEFVIDELTEGPGLQEMLQERQTPTRAPSVQIQPATGSGGPLSFAPVFNINGAQDPEAVAAIAEKRMRGVLNDWLVQTEEAIG